MATVKPDQVIDRQLWVGTYEEKGGEGIYPLVLQGKGQCGAPCRSLRNCSFGAWSPRHRLHYLVNEQKGTLTVCRRKDRWAPLGQYETGGSQPCYVALSPDQSRLAVANYGSGSIAVFPINEQTGCPDGPPRVRRVEGKGPNRERQEGPHAHCVAFSPDQCWLYHVDLGTDELLAYSLEAGLGGPEQAFRAPAGSGPRHLLHHGEAPLALLLSELASTIHLLEGRGPDWTALQLVSTLPEGWTGDSLGGHVGLNAAGDRVYVTNRGHDSIATFALDHGKLALLGHVPSGGKSPRFFILLEDEGLLLVAHEDSGNVTGFDVAGDGTLTQNNIDVAVPGSVYLFDDPR